MLANEEEFVERLPVPDVDDLREDVSAAWVADVAGNVDLPVYLRDGGAGGGPPFQILDIPKADGSRMRIHVLHPGRHAALHRAVDDIRIAIDESLGPGVFGYRRGADRSASYSQEWLAFNDLTAQLSRDAEWVVLADVSSFFSSLSWVRVAEAVTEIDSGAPKSLLKLAADFQQSGLEYLPSGYGDARLLANAVLGLVDKRLEVPITRWVDDYRLFVPAASDPGEELDALQLGLRGIGLELNHAKTQVVPAERGVEVSRNSLTSVYHPDRDPPEQVRHHLHKVFYRALEDPKEHRREIRFLLPRLAEQGDDVALSFAFHGLNAFPWEAPRLIRYIATFADRQEVHFLVNAHLAAAARSADAWMVARLGALGCRMPLSDFAAEALARNLERLIGSPAWGLGLRALAVAGRREAAEIATAANCPDPRSALVSLRDLGLPAPKVLRDEEPVLASILDAGPAPLPPIDTIL
jgi:hypothetical protein